MLDISKVKLNKNYKVYFTYNDIKDFPEYPEGPMVELFNGELFMPPSPNTIHQQISFNLTLLIGKYLEDKNIGKLFTAPFDIVLSEKNVFAPDLVYVSSENNHIITEKNISGTPDFIIEILSTNKTNDLVVKKEIYEKFGVKEYWIVDPVEEMILIHVLEDQKYRLVGKYSKSNKIINCKTIDFDISVELIFK